MIDLTAKLPDSLIVGGHPYTVLTDFRIWLRLNEMVQDDFELMDTSFIFADEIPTESWIEPMFEFLASPNATPKQSRSNKKLYDFLQDGDYIFGSFMQAYGIDLTESHMHWHKFKALFASLPDETKMARIIGYRSYEHSNKSADDAMRELRDAWELPREEITEEEYAEFFED